MKLFLAVIRYLSVISLVTLLAACGSSGSNKAPSSQTTSSLSSVTSTVIPSSSSSSTSVILSSSSSSSSSSTNSTSSIASNCSFGTSAVSLNTINSTRVEAENYDICAESFFDSDPENTGGAYRQDSVDITANQDSSNHHYVSDMNAGEYLEYSLIVERSGMYSLSYRVLPSLDESTASTELVLLLGDKEVKSTSIEVSPNANATWLNITRSNIYLSDGLQTLRLKVNTGKISLDYLEFIYTEDLSLDPHAAVADMGIGINLGNTLDAPTEGAWAPRAQESYLIAFKDAGFGHVRIPVTWDAHTGKTAPYKVNAQHMDRVEQVVDWALAQGYYVTLNAHHEAWFKDNYSTNNNQRFNAIWQQVAERFRHKSARLMFEILNEPVGLTVAQVNDINTRIIDIIRATNPTRLVIFAGNDFSGIASLLAIGIPRDDYLIGNFHSYDPWAFAGECTRGWGSPQDIQALTNIYQSARDWSVQHDIPVMLNEFGAAHYDFTKPKNICVAAQRLEYLQTHVNLAFQHGVAATVWDDNGSFGIYHRETASWGAEKDVLVSKNTNHD